ncbi:MAG: hypothetical protein IPL62_10325 [Caulobacteraceae bacterium]|nr:hypothetical protein [Caulobacteraceae bacterium]
MPWNDQSGGPPRGGSQGPWGGGPRKPWGQQQPPRQTPPPQGPDLDDLLRQWRERFFGGGGSGGGTSGGRRRGLQWPVIAGLLAVGWLATGIYQTDEGEQAVITQFGDYNRSTGPGIHYHLPVPSKRRRSSTSPVSVLRRSVSRPAAPTTSRTIPKKV